MRSSGLLLLGLEPLLQARVCKEWRAIIKSAQFRALWRPSSQDDCVLLTAYTSHWQHPPRPFDVCAWSTESRVVSPLPAWMKLPLPLGSFFDIVASCAGMVVIRQPSWPDRDTPGAELTVDNPATNEWVRIPRLDDQRPGRVYSMSADPATGEFTVLDFHNDCVYESSSKTWRSIPRPSVPEIDDSTTALIGCIPSVWEHKGEHYRACAVDIGNIITYKVGVWTGGQCRRRRIASDDYLDPFDDTGPWRRAASMELDETDVFADVSVEAESHGEGHLMCIAGQARNFFDDGTSWRMDGYGFPLPPVVYDLDRDEWMHIRAKSTTDVHYRRAVVYRPSLVKPSGAKSALALNPEGGEGHKRKREQELPETVASIRQRRTTTWEFCEDVFYIM